MKYLLGLLSLVFVLGCSYKSGSVTGQTESSDGINYDSLRIILEKVHDVDQGYRARLSKMGEPGPELAAEVKKADARNLAQVTAILDEYGWLAKGSIGLKASEALYLVVQRSDLATMEKYFPQLKEQAEKGNATKRNAAILEDKILVRKRQKQRYGTQARARTLPSGDVEYFIWPVEDPSGVNARRSKMGFKLTVEESAHRLNAVYNPREELVGG